MEDEKKLIKLILSKKLREKHNISQEQLKKLLREYYSKHLDYSKQKQEDKYKIFDGGLDL